MPEPAVDDVGLLDAGFEAVEAGLDLGDHPLVDHPSGDQVAAVLGGQAGDEAVGVVAVGQDPGVSVRKTSFSALSAMATAAAAVSAFTL